jgi:hypothetical protein
MAVDPFDSGDLNDPRITRQRTRRTGEAVSRLCSSWFRAGGDLLVGSLEIAEQVAEDLTDTYCDRPRRKPPAGD